MTELTGRNVKICMINNYFYNAKVISEDEKSITIVDRFRSKLILNRDAIRSIQILEGGQP